MKKRYFIYIMLLFSSNVIIGQNEIELRSDGIVVPRTIATSVSNPVEGQLIYDLDSEDLVYYDGTSWQFLGSGSGGSGAFERSGTLVRQSEGVDTDDFIFGRSSIPQNGEVIVDGFILFDQSNAAFLGGSINTSPNPWTETVRGLSSFAYGENVVAEGDFSFAFGKGSRAVGLGSTAFGRFSSSSNEYATAFGDNCFANGEASTAFGKQTLAYGNYSTSLGKHNVPLVEQGDALGVDGPLLIVGNGTSLDDRNNALVVRQNGQVEFDNYTFPIDDGTNGQVMTTDGGGQLSWNTPTDDWSNGSGLIYHTAGNVAIGTSLSFAKLKILANSEREKPTLDLVESENDFVRQSFSRAGTCEQWFVVAKPEASNSQDDAYMNFFYSDNGEDDGNCSAGGFNVLSLRGNGNALIAGNTTIKGDLTVEGTYSNPSDIRYKKDITPLKSTLSSLTQMGGYRYNWKSNKDPRPQIGLIAQEVQAQYPELVSENEEGMLSVSYTKMVPVLLEAIKEQQEMIKSLEARLTKLEK